jgi:hypothetical protein
MEVATDHTTARNTTLGLRGRRWSSPIGIQGGTIALAFQEPPQLDQVYSSWSSLNK